MGVSVRAPDGRAWIVSRSVRWPPFRPKLGLGVNTLPLDAGLDGGIIGGIIALVVIWILLTILVVVLLPVIALIIELSIATIGTLLFRRAWVVQAETVNPPYEVREWRVRGLFRSRAAVREVADELRRGVPAEPEHALR